MPKREIVDTETGELHFAAFHKTPRHRIGFTMLFQDATLTLLTEHATTLTALHLRVLLYLLATTEFENQVALHVTEIAAALGHDRSATSRALSTLEGIGVIRRKPQPGNRPDQIVIDPHLAFRGKVGQKNKLLAQQWAATT
jgi:hypothetical protein